MPLPDRRAIWFERLTRAVRADLGNPDHQRLAHGLLAIRADPGLDDQGRLDKGDELLDAWGEHIGVGPRPR